MGFKFKLGSGDKMEYLLGGALALIILLALWLTVRHVMSGGEHAKIPTEVHFKCLNTSCNWEKAFKTREVPVDFQRVHTGEVRRAVCPDCGKAMVVPMDQCPSCKAYYVSRARVAADPGYLVGGAGKEVCPKCGIDITQYNKDHAKK